MEWGEWIACTVSVAGECIGKVYGGGGGERVCKSRDTVHVIATPHMSGRLVLAWLGRCFPLHTQPADLPFS